MSTPNFVTSLDASITIINNAIEKLNSPALDKDSKTSEDKTILDHTKNALSKLATILQSGIDINEINLYNDWARYSAYMDIDFNGKDLNSLNNFYLYKEIGDLKSGKLLQKFGSWAAEHKSLIKNVGRIASALEIGSYVNDIINSDDPIAELAEIGVKVGADYLIGAGAAAAMTAIGVVGAPAILGGVAIGIVGSILLDKPIEDIGEYLGKKLTSIESVGNISEWLDGSIDNIEDGIKDSIDNSKDFINDVVNDIADNNLINKGSDLLQKLF